MKKIERFRTATLTGKCSAYNAPMIQDDNGGYVRYESHREILRSVEAELAALKAMQKSDFFYHVKPIFEKAFEDFISAMVKQASQSVFKVDTEALIAADVARWMEKHMNERAGFATGGLYVGDVKSDLKKMNDALIKGGVVTESELFPFPKANNAHYVLCTGAEEGSHFTIGKHYVYDRHVGGVIRICQDDLVSDLSEDDCWFAEEKRSAVDGSVSYYLAALPGGKASDAKFKIVK